MKPLYLNLWIISTAVMKILALQCLKYRVTWPENNIVQSFGWLSEMMIKEKLWQLVLPNWTVRLARAYWNGCRYQRIIADVD